MNKIYVKKAGLLTTIQDKGRWGYQQYGMSVAGAMDHFSMRVANLLVGNSEYEAVIEATFLGPEIVFECNEIIAITGADMSPKLNGDTIPMWSSILVEKGDVLSFSGVTKGLRSYISFSRVLDVPEIMGSKSTFLRGNLGGFEGRKLADGDSIPLGDTVLNTRGSYLPNKFIPNYVKEGNIRVVLGPQNDYFTEDAINTFLSSSYKITSEADRMGYRLDGPSVNHKDGADIISDGIVFGSIQVPGHGSPIIMMADRQTTGGYTKIATVITPDLGLLAQMGPDSTINFKEVSISESNEIYKEHEERFLEIKEFIQSNRIEFKKDMMMSLNLSGKSYEVVVREVEKEKK